MTMRRVRQVALLAAVLALISVNGWGQAAHDVTITGTVTASNGDTLPGVTVVVAGPALVTGERQVITDTEGKFVFLSVPPGTYKVTASLQGFNKYAAPGIVLHAGDSTNLKVTLQPEKYQEQMTVTASAPIVDTKSSTVATTFDSQLLDKLPTARNAFYDLAMTAPGMASVGADESWLPSPSAFGGAANDNIFLVNGVNTTNPRGAPWGSLVLVNYNTVEEVKVISLGSKAEYGSFSGAAIDVVTKSGGNEYKGDVAYYSMLGNAANNNTDKFPGIFFSNPGDQLNNSPKKNWEGTATLGGPVLRDRLWFYAGFSKSHAETKIPLFQPLSLWDSKIYDGKLTGEFLQKHRVWLAYHHENNVAGNNTWSPTWDPTMVYNQPRNNHTIQAQYQLVATDRDLTTAKYLAFSTQEHPSIPATVGHPGYVNWWAWTGADVVGVNGDFPNVEGQKSKRSTIQIDHTHYAAHFLGEHEMKFGVQYTAGQGNWFGGYFQGYFNGAYPVSSWYGNNVKDWAYNCDKPGCNWMDATGEPWGSTANPVVAMYNWKIYMNPWLTVRKSGSTGAFIDDTWGLTQNLTVNLGLRYDRQTAKYGDGTVYQLNTTPEGIYNPVFERTRAGTGNLFDFRTWSPRLGMAWSITGDQRTVLRAHYGRYYSPIGVETLRRFGPDMEPSLNESWLHLFPMSEVDLNHDGTISTYELTQMTRLMANHQPTKLLDSWTRDPSWSLSVAPGTKSPYTDQFLVSLQRQLGSTLTVEGSYIFKRTKNLISLEPYNELTGQPWEWAPHDYTTWRNYKTTAWGIVMKDYNGDGKIDSKDGTFVNNNTAYRAVNVEKFAGNSGTGRTYNGLQFVLNKRYENRWQGMASVNWNTSSGLAARTIMQDTYIDGPMIMDTAWGQSLNDFVNNDGPLPMTPKWLVKISGSYTIPVVEADFGLRYRYDSGRPLWPVDNNIPRWASWNPTGLLGAGPIVADNPKNPDWFPASNIVDLNVGRTFKVQQYGVNVSFDVFNAFNDSSPNRIGFTQYDYGRVFSIVQPRTYRLGLKFLF